MSSDTRLPDWNLSLPWVQASSSRPTSASGVHVLLHQHTATRVMTRVRTHVSAPGMNFLFMGVSRVTGRMAAARQLSGSPDPEQARLFVKWCTAAFCYCSSLLFLSLHDLT